MWHCGHVLYPSVCEWGLLFARVLSFAFPSYISRPHHFGWDFWVYDSFFNPTIEVVTFRLRGWCMLRVFLGWHSPVLGMNVRIFWVCVMECMCAQTRPVYTLIQKSFWGMESEPIGKISSTVSPQRRIKPMTLHRAGQWAQHTTNMLFRPPRPPSPSQFPDSIKTNLPFFS